MAGVEVLFSWAVELEPQLVGSWQCFVSDSSLHVDSTVATG